eukprot:scaffold12364_cov113-Skeletonema_marinoi.AAC.4
MMTKHISRIHMCDCSRHIIPSKKCFFLQKNCIIILLLFISRSVALIIPSNSIPVINRRIQSYSNKENVAVLFSRLDKFDSEPSTAQDVADDDDVDYATIDTKQDREKDDLTEEDEADDYIGKFISDALEEKSSTDEKSSEDEPSAIIETKRMIEKQQEQIDLLMNMVKQQNQGQLSPSSQGDNSRSRSSIHQSSQSLQPKPSTNVAPLKANLFIDGTWLYYSLNTRNPDRCPIIKKFGKGWQNNYKVDWLALPKLICSQMEKQRYSKTSFTKSERPIEIARIMVFTSAKRETDPNSIRMRMFRDMANANYDVHMMETVGQGEKCVDIQLAVEMLHYATVPNAYDVAILLSGDKDFVPALVRTRQKGKQLCISSMRAGCNRVLYESPHIRDYDVVWLESCLDELIVPIPAEERSRRDRAGYASVFTMMRVLRDFVEALPNNEWVSSRDIGTYLKSIQIADSNMLEELKQSHGGLRTFLMERACNLFDVQFPDERVTRTPGDHSFFVRVKGDSDETLINEFKRTQFFTKEEKIFLEEYKKDKYILDDSYQHTATSLLEMKHHPNKDGRQEADIDADLVDGASANALDYSQLTVAKLKEICREKGLPVSGKKGDLIQRLEEDRQLEYEIIKKQQKQAREAREASVKRSNRRVQTQSEKNSRSAAHVREKPSVPGNVYAASLPQLDASRYRNARVKKDTAVDPAVKSHLEALVKEYLTASGGTAGSRDIGRYLAANSDSRRGNRSALTELKETYGSLLTFILTKQNSFLVLDKSPGYGGDEGFPIKLIK